MIDDLDPTIEARVSGDLWVAVILQAIADAHNNGKTNRRAKVEARAWFEEAGEDFLEVCDLAGVDPGIIRDVALNPLPATFNSSIGGLRVAERIVVEQGFRFTKAELARLAALSPAPLSRRQQMKVEYGKAKRAQTSKVERVPRVRLTDEERRERRNARSANYYLKNKDKRRHYLKMKKELKREVG